MNQISDQDESTLWSRLRESIDRLATLEHAKTDPTIRAERLAARARQLRGRMVTESPREAASVILTFNKGNQRYGIPVEDVIEVQSLEQFCPVPGTPPFIAGVIHWRGVILALLDLGKLFGFAEPGLADVHVAVIVESGGHRIAIPALEVEEILTIPASAIQPLPELPASLPAEWVSGVHEYQRLILRPANILQDARLVEWREQQR